MAEYLFEMQAIDLKAGQPTFEHPGYEFFRPWKQGNLPVWYRPVAIQGINGHGVEVPILVYRVDVETIDLLRKYDSKNLWENHLGDWLAQAYHLGDLETLIHLYPLKDKVKANNRMAQQKVASAFKHGDRRYPTDPFLSSFPVKLPDIGNRWALPLWEYHPHDNAAVRELKKQLQEMVLGDPFP